MAKHHQSAALGRLSDFSERPTAPPGRELPDIPIEARVVPLEQSVNEILHQLADLSERLDQPRGDPVFDTPPKQVPKPPEKQVSKQPENKSQETRTSAPTPAPKPERLSKEQVATLSDRIYALLLDGTSRTKAEICEAVGCDKQQYSRARTHLIKTKRMQKDTDLVTGQICNVPGGPPIWTQEQVDAELQRRKAKINASDNNT